MTQHSRQRLLDQVDSLRRQFAQTPGLPLGAVLSPAAVEQAFQAESGAP